MAESFPFTTYSGLLEPKHYKRIGSAIWLFLWCISSTTQEVVKDGIVWGIVLGNKPLKIHELAKVFDVNEKTVRRWLDTLEQHGYIHVTRAPYGLILTVKNSKKYKGKRVDKNVHSQTDRTNMSEPEWTEMSDHPDKNVHSNKDITGDITSDDGWMDITAREEENKGDGMPITDDAVHEISPLRKIENHFLMRRNSGVSLSPDDYELMQELINDGVPVSDIIAGIDHAFDTFEPRFKRDRIRSFAYCEPIIRQRYHQRTERKKAEGRLKSNESSRQHDTGYSRSHKPITGGKTGWLNRPTGSDV